MSAGAGRPRGDRKGGDAGAEPAGDGPAKSAGGAGDAPVSPAASEPSRDARPYSGQGTAPDPVPDAPDSRALLRHTVATLAYRAGKALRDAPEGFGDFRVAEGTRTPAEILAHLCDLLEWAIGMIDGVHRWVEIEVAPWDDEVELFFERMERFDRALGSAHRLGYTPGHIFQGPIADALTHVGQISMLRRLAGGPVRGENYFKAEITRGRVGPEQAGPRYEFD